MSLKKLMSILSMLAILKIIAVVNLNAVTYEKLPHYPHYRGFYYWLEMADYENLLMPNIPYEIMVGYIVADSIVRKAPGTRFLPDSIKKLNLQSDTVAYLCKYWYLLNEYDPLRFQAFMEQKHTDAKVAGHTVQSYMYSYMHEDPRMNYVYPAYILHISVNNTVHIDSADENRPKRWSKTITYCNVLDTLKGKVFPSLNNAVFYNGDLPDSVSNIINNTIPQNTDIVFYYMNQWQRWGFGSDPLIDEDGNPWVKPNKEYIVFLEIWGEDNLSNPDGSINRHYYSIAPFREYGSRSMYPIEDGFVIDKGNILGFGEKVPVDVFKQNIRNKIEEIKNYGD